jgi:ketosteroid isomerase-like protein
MTTDDLIRRAFDAYNRQDSGTLLALVSDDVLWPGEAHTLRGKDALRVFLERQWTRTRTHDEVVHVEERDGYVVASLSQTVRSVEGRTLSTGEFRYGFVVGDGLIKQLKTRDA